MALSAGVADAGVVSDGPACWLLAAKFVARIDCRTDSRLDAEYCLGRDITKLNWLIVGIFRLQARF